MELSEEYVRDQVTDRLKKSLTLFGPCGLSEKVLDMAIKLSVSSALNSSQVWMQNMVSAESAIVLEGCSTVDLSRSNKVVEET